MQGQWQGQWGGSWQGNAGEGGNPVVIAGLSVQSTGDATLSPKAIIRAALIASGEATSALAGQLQTPTPENGPSGGANWTRGYKPTHDYIKQRRRNKRDELLFLTA